MNVALSDESGRASFLLDHASGAAGSLEAVAQKDDPDSLHSAYQMSETFICTTASVDGLIAEGVLAPSLVKIDVEGAEHLVLSGAKAFLSTHRPTLIIETSNSELVRELVDLGYIALQIDSGNLLFIDAKSDFDLEPIFAVFQKHP